MKISKNALKPMTGNVFEVEILKGGKWQLTEWYDEVREEGLLASYDQPLTFPTTEEAETAIAIASLYSGNPPANYRVVPATVRTFKVTKTVHMHTEVTVYGGDFETAGNVALERAMYHSDIKWKETREDSLGRIDLGRIDAHLIKESK